MPKPPRKFWKQQREIYGEPVNAPKFMTAEPYKMSGAPRQHPEDDLQIKCVKYLRGLGDKVLSWSTPNHLYRGDNTKDEGAFKGYMDKQRLMGMRKGVLDLTILKKGRREKEVEVIFTELKIGSNDYTPEQADFASAAERLGCTVFKIYTYEEFVSCMASVGL